MDFWEKRCYLYIVSSSLKIGGGTVSMAIGHFAFGAGATTAVIMATGLNKKIKNTEPIRVAGGIFAMIPDAGKLIPSLDILHNGWWNNIFWLHGFLDKVDPRDTALASFWFILFMLVIFSAFWLEQWTAYR